MTQPNDREQTQSRENIKWKKNTDQKWRRYKKTGRNMSHVPRNWSQECSGKMAIMEFLVDIHWNGTHKANSFFILVIVSVLAVARFCFWAWNALAFVRLSSARMTRAYGEVTFSWLPCDPKPWIVSGYFHVAKPLCCVRACVYLPFCLWFS